MLNDTHMYFNNPRKTCVVKIHSLIMSGARCRQRNKVGERVTYGTCLLLGNADNVSDTNIFEHTDATLLSISLTLT